MADNLFKLIIISPDRTFYEGDVKMVEMVTTEGEIGVLKGHIPLTSIMKPGIVTIKEENEIKRAAVHEGFVEILQDRVTIMAEIAEWPEEIDLHRAEEAKERAEKRLKSNENGFDITRAEFAMRKALIRIELVQRYKQ